jgi:hypothetical protein
MIYTIRGVKVLLDCDLADLYQVETKVLTQSVKRNTKRFPDDFIFQLTETEVKELKREYPTFKASLGRRRYPPYVFTEHGVSMLSSVLNSDLAIEINIYIIRVFVKLRQLLEAEKSLSSKIADIEKGSNKLFRIVFEKLDKIEEEVDELKEIRKTSPNRKVGIKS